MRWKGCRKKRRRWRLWFWTIAVLSAFIAASVGIARTSIPMLRQIATHEVRRVTSQLLVDAVRQQSLEIKRNDQGFMAGEVQEAMASILQRAYESFRHAEIDVLENQGNRSRLRPGVVYEVPLGSIMYVPFFVNSGPMIPVRMRLLGDVMGSMRSKVTPYGINNALVEILVELKVRVQVVSPLVREEIEVSQEVPLAIEVLQGEVPYYFPWHMSQSYGSMSNDQ